MDTQTFDLFEAARTGTKDDAALAIAFGANINARNVIGFTPLHYAAWRGNVPVVDLLLRMKDIEIAAMCPEGLTAAHFAVSPCVYKNPSDVAEVLKLLCAAGADMNAPTPGSGDTVIMRAIASSFPGAVEYLASLPGVDLDARDGKGRTPEQWGVDFGSDAIVTSVSRRRKRMRTDPESSASSGSDSVSSGKADDVPAASHAAPAHA
jgi:ankyrin repeat protein